jgi:hypothetical protein
VATEAKQPLPALAYNFLEQEYDDSEYVFRLPIFPCRQDEEEQCIDRTAWWLDSRTRGLLEVDRESGTVLFLHRTVSDFLRTRDMADYLTGMVPSNFHAITSLMKICLAIIKRRQFPDIVFAFPDIDDTPGSQVTLRSLTSAVLSYAAEIDHSSPASSTAFRAIDELDNVLVEKFALKQAYLESGCSPQSFLRSQLLGGMSMSYLSRRLPRDPTYFAFFEHLFIPFMITKRAEWGLYFDDDGILSTFPWEYTNRRLGTLRLALQTQNLDPNSCHMGRQGHRSPWTWLIYHMKSQSMTDEQFWELVKSDIFSLLLRRGADARATVKSGNSKSSAIAVYTNRGWRAPPTKTHEEKYLQDLRDLLAAGIPRRYFGFSSTVANDLASLATESSTDMLRHSWRVVVKSIEILLDHMAGNAASSILARKRLVDGLLSVAKAAFPREVYPDLEAQCISMLECKRSKSKRKAAETDAGSKSRKVRKVTEVAEGKYG